MFDAKHYVPLLQWKRGEQIAIKNLPLHIKEKITPLIRIVPIAWDYKNNRPSKTLDDHLKKISPQIKDFYGLDRPVFIDIDWLNGTERMMNQQHPLKFVIDSCRSNGVKVIPVTGYNRPSNYQAEVKAVNSIDKFGICIRLQENDFSDIKTRIDSLLNTFNENPVNIDLVIDMKYIRNDQQVRYALSCVSMINMIPYLDQWRNLILAATSIPQDLSSIRTESVGTIKRLEWITWKYLTHDKSLKRIPIFGDYTISNTEYFDAPPAYLNSITANIRYTSDEEFVIYRGNRIIEGSWAQMRQLCQQLIADPRYCGPAYSWGDQYIFDCAAGSVSPGNAETWRRVGTNHHITFVVDQLANFF